MRFEHDTYDIDVYSLCESVYYSCNNDEYDYVLECVNDWIMNEYNDNILLEDIVLNELGDTTEGRNSLLKLREKIIQRAKDDVEKGVPFHGDAGQNAENLILYTDNEGYKRSTIGGWDNGHKRINKERKSPSGLLRSAISINNYLDERDRSKRLALLDDQIKNLQMQKSSLSPFSDEYEELDKKIDSLYSERRSNFFSSDDNKAENNRIYDIDNKLERKAFKKKGLYGLTGIKYLPKQVYDKLPLHLKAVMKFGSVIARAEIKNYPESKLLTQTLKTLETMPPELRDPNKFVQELKKSLANNPDVDKELKKNINKVIDIVEPLTSKQQDTQSLENKKGKPAEAVPERKVETKQQDTSTPPVQPTKPVTKEPPKQETPPLQPATAATPQPERKVEKQQDPSTPPVQPTKPVTKEEHKPQPSKEPPRVVPQSRLSRFTNYMKNNKVKGGLGVVAAGAAIGGSIYAYKRFKNKPRSVIAKRIAALRGIYKKFMINAQRNPKKANVFKRIAVKILSVIDKLLHYLQNKADGR